MHRTVALAGEESGALQGGRGCPLLRSGPPPSSGTCAVLQRRIACAAPQHFRQPAWRCLDPTGHALRLVSCAGSAGGK